MRVYQQAGQPLAVAVVLVEDLRNFPAAFQWASQIDVPEVWRYVGLAQLAAYQHASSLGGSSLQ